jgi:Uma2 family endonuclease
VEVTSEVEAYAMALPRADLAAAEQADLAELERLWYEARWPDGVRVELIDGELVVSPSPGRRHSNAAMQLVYMLSSDAQRNGWELHANLTAYIEATRERLIPDLLVIRADSPGDQEVPSSGVLLAAEVVSPSSRRRDREQKKRAYAQGGVPLYLLIDRFSTPPAMTLFSDLGPEGYQSAKSAAAGQPLRLPAPFDISLDTTRLLA